MNNTMIRANKVRRELHEIASRTATRHSETLTNDVISALRNYIAKNRSEEVKRALDEKLTYYIALSKIGYNEKYGYYFITSGDKNNIISYELAKDRGTIIDEVLRDMVHSVAFDMAMENLEYNIKRFRFFEENSKIIENECYTYNCQYDPRVAWFETHLSLMRSMRDPKTFYKEVNALETEINIESTVPKDKRWIYNTTTGKFDIVTK